MTVDEMTRVRELRADAPAPDRARLAPGRARLVEAARTAERRRSARGRRKLVVAAAFAAVTAVAVTATVMAQGNQAGRKVTPAVSPSPSLDLKGMSTRELLERAAETVERQPPVVEPRADQWIYTKETQEGGDRDIDIENWLRYDGTASAFDPMGMVGKKGGEVQITPMNLEGGGDDDRSPRQMYRFVSTLPTDADGVLKALREEDAIADEKGRSQAWNDYAEISVLLDAYVLPPKGVAGLYRALATVPHGTVVGHLVEDGAGHRAIALRFPRGGSDSAEAADEWLLDPVTYQIVGERMIENGKVIGGNAYLAKAVVDKAGRRS
ncbi:CU044_5270 family protein [Streptomyces sp. ISL-22]|nr:CU044_5270 family protein [Streptomyces sp. ISL-24]MBT2433339.1 CU044_5270 family protein [Streptomyces sp. ISL-22]